MAFAAGLGGWSIAGEPEEAVAAACVEAEFSVLSAAEVVFLDEDGRNRRFAVLSRDAAHGVDKAPLGCEAVHVAAYVPRARVGFDALFSERPDPLAIGVVGLRCRLSVALYGTEVGAGGGGAVGGRVCTVYIYMRGC